jgi:hypothetical protein
MINSPDFFDVNFLELFLIHWQFSLQLEEQVWPKPRWRLAGLVVDKAKSKHPADQVFGVGWSGEDLEFVC